jgi:C-terminal processing protease CtpA/Prc
VKLLLACAFAVVVACGGSREQPAYVVGTVLDGYDATGKLAIGDRIVAIDGVALREPVVDDLVARVNAAGGASVTVAFERDGEHREVVLAPTRDHRARGDVWVLGIKPVVAARRR